MALGRLRLPPVAKSWARLAAAPIPTSRRFSTGEPSVAAAEAEIQELKAMLEGLVLKVDRLASAVERKNCNSLLELQAVLNPGEPVRREAFRPTVEMVRNQVNRTCHLDCMTLTTLAIQGDSFARRERMLREIMYMDGVSWDEAHEKLIEMDIYCERPYWLQTLPYRLGILLAVAGVISSCLMVFSKSVAVQYAENVAGEDLPEGVEDVSQMTYNQVGTWTWAWNEPMIGTASFVLLCLQFGRAQCTKMKMYPYTEAMLRWRGNRVAKQYPQYDGAAVRAWAKIMPAVGMNLKPNYKRHLYTKENRIHNFRGAYHAND